MSDHTSSLVLNRNESHHQGIWSTGMILALGVRGPESSIFGMPQPFIALLTLTY